MTRKILRRCDICGKFHAAYLVPTDGGQPFYYCYECWKARFETSPPQDTYKSDAPPDAADPKKKFS